MHRAIEAADAEATLTLCAGTWNLTRAVVISKTLTLIGAGADATVLDGGDAVQVLQIASVTVTLQDLTIRKGYGDLGGGIVNNGTLTLRGVGVTGSLATSGGGIYNDGGTVSLQTGSSVTGN